MHPAQKPVIKRDARGEHVETNFLELATVFKRVIHAFL